MQFFLKLGFNMFLKNVYLTFATKLKWAVPTYMGNGEETTAIVSTAPDILCCPGQTIRVQIQKSTGPLAVGDPAWARGLDKMNFRGPFQSQLFCSKGHLSVSEQGRMKDYIPKGVVSLHWFQHPDSRTWSTFVGSWSPNEGQTMKHWCFHFYQLCLA